LKRRRARDRRENPYVCRRCATPLQAVGGSIGATILKCPTCRVMDRRLPSDRRVIPPELVRPPRRWRQLALVLLEMAVVGAIGYAAVVRLW